MNSTFEPPRVSIKPSNYDQKWISILTAIVIGLSFWIALVIDYMELNGVQRGHRRSSAGSSWHSEEVSQWKDNWLISIKKSTSACNAAPVTGRCLLANCLSNRAKLLWENGYPIETSAVVVSKVGSVTPLVIEQATLRWGRRRRPCI